MTCPKCKIENNDNWPIVVKASAEQVGKMVISKYNVVSGGCQSCWEKQCDESHWRIAVLIDNYIKA